MVEAKARGPPLIQSLSGTRESRKQRECVRERDDDGQKDPPSARFWLPWLRVQENIWKLQFRSTTNLSSTKARRLDHVCNLSIHHLSFGYAQRAKEVMTLTCKNHGSRVRSPFLDSRYLPPAVALALSKPSTSILWFLFATEKVRGTCLTSSRGGMIVRSAPRGLKK